jgi:hypothetical protein
MATPRVMTYQTFELTARPRHLSTGKWTTEVLIRRNKVVKRFTGTHTFDTEDEAVIHSLDFGRKMIDGVAPELDIWIS